jgi:hypothetical protein
MENAPMKALLRDRFLAFGGGDLVVSPRTVGILEKALPWALGVCCAWIIGWFCATLLGLFLQHQVMESRIATVIRAASASDSGSGVVPVPEGMRLFVARSPFGVASGRALSEDKGASPETPVEKEAAPVADIGKLSLVGTMPPVAAWLVGPGGTSLVLQGQRVEGWLLRRVAKNSVLLAAGEEEHELFFRVLDGGEQISSKPASKKRAPEAPTPPPAGPSSSPAGNLTPAAPGQEGVIARDTMNELLLNPFDELKKVRLVPKITDGVAAGIEVRNIEKNSILFALGVRPGDVIQGVNGIPITNMGDVANAINSLMGGERFEVSVLRKDEPVQLNYVVR